MSGDEQNKPASEGNPGHATGPDPQLGPEYSAMPESLEREAAMRRSEDDDRAALDRDPYTGLADPSLAHRAFATMAENVRDYAVFLMDANGIISFWGEGARRMKWWTRRQAEGAHLRLLYPDGGSEDGTAEAHLQEAAERGEYTGEGQRIRADGSTFWAGLTLTALRDTDGELVGFVKVARDLTARRAADAVLSAAVEEAETARREAEDASLAKSQFLATMSHEIRTPINAVMGYADLLDLGVAGSLNAEQRQHLARIRASNRHLLGVIDEILDFARLEAGRVTIGSNVGWLREPIEAACEIVHEQARSKGLDLSIELSDFAAEVPYQGDESRVRQILLALLSNAIKFTPSGGRIAISAGTAEQPPPDADVEAAGPWVYIRIEDNGPGIPPDRHQEVFEPFEQVDMTLTRRYGGTGLGLTIARRLANLMAGDLTLRSQPGVGSAFSLWLPAAAREAIEARHAELTRISAPGPRLLREVHDAIVAEIERILHAYVARLSSDPAAPTAHTVSQAELENHLAAFLSDLAHTFSRLDLVSGADAPALRDATAIRRTVSERHGYQRARLGWQESEIIREFEILREEVAAAIRRRIHDARPEELKDAVDAVNAIIDDAERVSIQRFHAATRSAERWLPEKRDRGK
jgi:PAS domain S-box-containing protein